MYLIHFAVSLLSQLNISWAWLTNAPMPQPLSVFDCVVKAKSMKFSSALQKHAVENQVARYGKAYSAKESCRT